MPTAEIKREPFQRQLLRMLEHMETRVAALHELQGLLAGREPSEELRNLLDRAVEYY